LHSWDVVVSDDPAAVLPQSSVELLVDRIAFLAERVGKADAAPPKGVIGIQTSDPQRRYLLSIREVVEVGTWTDEKTDGLVEIPAEALLRLVYGRLDPAHTPPGIKTEGDVDLVGLRNISPGF
jgi:hypothetical protein